MVAASRSGAPGVGEGQEDAVSTVCWCGHQECPVVRHERTQCVDACTVCLRAELAAARAVLAEPVGTDVARAHVEALVKAWDAKDDDGLTLPVRDPWSLDDAMDSARGWLAGTDVEVVDVARLTDVRAALESLRTRVAMASARAVDAGFLGYDPSRPDMAEALAKDAKAAGLAVPLTEGGGVMPIRDVFIGEGDAAAQKRVEAAMKEGRKLVETLLQRVCRENEELRADLAASRKIIAKLNDAVGAMCMDVAPSYIAVCRPAGDPTPWCHSQKGHIGPHRCGDDVWSCTST